MPLLDMPIGSRGASAYPFIVCISELHMHMHIADGVRGALQPASAPAPERGSHEDAFHRRRRLVLKDKVLSL